jgi:hypothetical protein
MALNVGETLAVDLISFSASKCPAVTTEQGTEALCVLDAGHVGQHVACTATRTIHTLWD